MRSVPEFVLLALVVTLTPGPATATIIRVSARDGRRAALSAIFGNSVGVLLWGCLSALGVSELVIASQVAYTLLRLGGALVLIFLGVRSMLDRASESARAKYATRRSGWRTGLSTSVTNPKLAVFFVAVFPQFLEPHSAVLPYTLAMAATIVAFDLVWYSLLSLAVVRAGSFLRPGFQRAVQRFTGAVLVAFGIRLAAQAR